MRAALVSQFAYPHDHEIRLKKIGSTLVEQGHDVHVLCKFDKSNPAPETSDGLRVHPNRIGARIPGLNQVLTVHLSFNPVWIIWLCWKLRWLDVDVVIVRNLRLAPPAIVAARLFSVPLVADLSENYAALAKIEGRTRPHHFLTRVPLVERFFERFTARRADHVWVVVPENGHRLAELAGVHPSKISVISNVPTKKVVSTLGSSRTRSRTPIYRRWKMPVI